MFSEEQLIAYVLDTANPAERTAIDRARRESPALRTQLRALENEFSDLALALPAAAPPPALRDRLLATVAETNRFERFQHQIAKCIDVSVAEASRLLAGIDRPESWVPGLIDGMELYHLEGGPQVAGAISGFIRLAAGTRFPQHRHLGEETIVVVQGQLREDDGQLFSPGEVATMSAGSEHAFSVPDGPDLIYLLVVFEGVDFGRGMVFRPGDPEL